MNPIIKKIARLFEPLIARIARAYVQREMDQEHYDAARGAFVGHKNERSAEYPFVLRQLDRVGANTVLDVGTGKTAWPHCMASAGYAVSAIDNITDYWEKDVWNRHWVVADHDIQRYAGDERYDAISCISVLEHVKDHRAAVINMFKMLNPGGHLLLTCPYNKDVYHENIYQHPEAGYGQGFKYICQVFSDTQMQNWLDDTGATLEYEELYQVFSGELWTFGESVYPIELRTRDELHHLGCFVMKKPG